jgi:hypothetical protein
MQSGETFSNVIRGDAMAAWLDHAKRRGFTREDTDASLGDFRRDSVHGGRCLL